MLITDVAIKNRITVAVVIALIIVAGTYSYITVPREASPDVPVPLILIHTPYEGVSPEDVESQLTAKIESELSGIKGLKEIRSQSKEGMSAITVEFEPEIVIEDALQRVRDKVDLAKPELPASAEEPVITEINFAEFPILIISLSGNISPVRLKGIADLLEDRIEQVPGVLEVEVIGAVEREIRLEVDPDRLAAYHLTLADLMSTIPAENVNISAGGLETEGTRFNVRVPAEFVSPTEADQLILKVEDGLPIYLTDVVTIEDTFKDRESFSRVNGKPNITLNVKKRIGANIVRIADHVKTILAEAQRQAPADVRIDVTADQSKNINMMLADLENNMLTALILVVGVLMLFLGFRTSIIVAMVIPLSMLMSIAIIQALGHTLNMVVLFSLILALGMLVDNAIVIVENIYRHMQLGYSHTQAAILGTREVAWPVTTSTATTVAAFAPMIFWPGIMGSFMKYLPTTVITVLVCSLFVALTINPTISSVFAYGRKKTSRPGPHIRAYRGFLEMTLATGWTRAVALAAAASILVIMVLLYALDAEEEFFPKIDPSHAAISIRSPQGTNIKESDRIARIVEQRLAPYQDEIDYIITTVGAGAGVNPLAEDVSGPHVTQITLAFKDYGIRDRPSADVIKDIREDLLDFAGCEIRIAEFEEGPPTGAVLTLRVMGEDFGGLEEISKDIEARIADVPGLINLRSNLETARPELVFEVDRREAKLAGVSTATIGYYLQMAIFGREVGEYREFNDEYDITLRLPLSQRQYIADLTRLGIPNIFGQTVPIRSLGEFKYQGGFGTVQRVDQRRTVTLTGDAVKDKLGAKVLKRVQQRLARDDLKLPPGYEIDYVGENEEMAKAKAFLLKAFAIAILLILIILVTQFNSISAPFIIATTVFLSLVGVLAGLVICNMPFGIIMTGIGVVSLAGVVVNNAIVLLDYTRQLQRRGMELIEAAVEAGATRLRPVLLTATTTILGLIPMATGISFNFRTFTFITRSETSQYWRSMAVAVIFGLAFATLLTLVVVPTLHVSLYRIRQRLGLVGARKQEDEGPLST